jgi:predicted lipoprotein
MRPLLLAALLLLPVSAPAQDHLPTIEAVVEEHILPGFADFAEATEILAETAEADCSPASPELRAAFGDAFDAWIEVSHLRFGPTETDNRGFELAFWPDPRGATQRTLGTWIREENPIAGDPEAFASASVAGRGFYALEMALYDPQLSAADPGYLCALITAQARDIARLAQAIEDDWTGGYAGLMLEPGNDVYRSPSEALQELYKALGTGLQFTSDTRLGLPLGSFDRPRPNLAEARRSGRSLRHVELSLTALRQLAGLLAAGTPDGSAALDDAFAAALARAESLDDPDLAGVAEPQGRLRVEILQQDIDRIRLTGAAALGPALGVAQGFNALDGD